MDDKSYVGHWNGHDLVTKSTLIIMCSVANFIRSIPIPVEVHVKWSDPPCADTESDRHCGMEWGWLTRLV